MIDIIKNLKSYRVIMYYEFKIISFCARLGE